jgi:Divergent InlB B-repeat domain
VRLAVALALAASLLIPSPAGAAAPPTPWCGADAESAADRTPDAISAFEIHVIYANPADGPDRFAELAGAIATDAASMDAWWRAQDASRAPRFDLAAFPDCASTFGRLDISAVRLPADAAAYAGDQYRLLERDLNAAGFVDPDKKYLVYYDGPVDDAKACGEGNAGIVEGGPEAFAVVYLQACGPQTPGDGEGSAAITAAHEMTHVLDAVLPEAPHQCEGGHVCDSPTDLMKAAGSATDTLSASVLDVGRDDYYGHAGGWDDLQDSPWLRKLDAQVTLSATVTGGGKVVSVQPGPECAATCSVEWDRGSDVTLEAIAPAGKRFVRWTGACRGELPCTLKLDAATTVSALFAQARFRLAVAVAGKGVVRSTPTGLACRVRCSAWFTSFKAVRLRATPNKGWRFARWTGGCTGTGACVVPMTKAAAVRAVFARRR